MYIALSRAKNCVSFDEISCNYVIRSAGIKVSSPVGQENKHEVLIKAKCGTTRWKRKDSVENFYSEGRNAGVFPSMCRVSVFHINVLVGQANVSMEDWSNFIGGAVQVKPGQNAVSCDGNYLKVL